MQEFQWRFKAEVDRENKALERQAQLAVWVINPWLKASHRLQVKDLITFRGAPKENWLEEFVKD